MPDRFTESAAGSSPLGRRRLLLSITLLGSITFSSFSMALAEIRLVTSQGVHRMGDRDTREDAVRLATEAAKRNALEQVATFLESVTVVEGVDITRDEIRTYTAGLVHVLGQQTNLTLDGDAVVVTVDLTAQIDTEEVGHAIANLRENEDARHQLVALKEEIDTLHQELESANQALALATTTEQIQQTSQQRQELLNRVQSNAIVSQAWTDWVLVTPVVYPYPWVGVARATASLNLARNLYPNSPYVQAAQYEMVTKQPPLPLQPPSAVQQAASRPIPLTLNEVSHSTSTQSPQIGDQTATGHQLAPTPSRSRRLTDVRQLNPLLPPPRNTPGMQQQVSPLGPRSARALQQFLQPPATAPPSTMEPPVAQRLPPRVNQAHSPAPQQVPRGPSHIAPHSSGGGSHGGGRGHGGGARGSGRGHGGGGLGR